MYYRRDYYQNKPSQKTYFTPEQRKKYAIIANAADMKKNRQNNKKKMSSIKVTENISTKKNKTLFLKIFCVLLLVFFIFH